MTREELIYHHWPDRVARPRGAYEGIPNAITQLISAR